MGNIGGLYTRKHLSFDKVKAALVEINKKRFFSELKIIDFPPEPSEKISGFTINIPSIDHNLFDLWIYSKRNISGKCPWTYAAWATWVHLIVLGELEKRFNGARWDEGLGPERWHVDMRRLKTYKTFCESDDGHWVRAEAIFPEKPVEIQRIIEKSK